MANQERLEMKKAVVSEITDKIKDSSSVVFFDYRGLTDEELTELRRKLKDNETDMKVYKNTLTKRALDNLQLVMEECVQGPSAVAFSKDAIAPIKILTDYAKDHVALSIKGGIVDGKASTMDVLSKLATIPSREGLLTMLAGGMIGIARDLSIALNLYAEQKENN
jgi:large subunit ribosomal protein L10